MQIISGLHATDSGHQDNLVTLDKKAVIRMARLVLVTMTILLALFSIIAIRDASAQERENNSPSSAPHSKQMSLPSDTNPPSSAERLGVVASTNGKKLISELEYKALRAFLRRYAVDLGDGKLQKILEINQHCDEQHEYLRRLLIKELALVAFQFEEQVIEANAERPLSPKLVDLIKVAINDAKSTRERANMVLVSEQERKGNVQFWKQAVFAAIPPTYADILDLQRYCKVLSHTTKSIEERHNVIAQVTEMFSKETGTSLGIEQHPYWSRKDYQQIPTSESLKQGVPPADSLECNLIIEQLHNKKPQSTELDYQTPDKLIASIHRQSGTYDFANAKKLNYMLLVGLANESSPSRTWHTKTLDGVDVELSLGGVAAHILGEGGTLITMPANTIPKSQAYRTELLRYRLIQLDPPPSPKEYVAECEKDIELLDKWITDKSN